MTMTQDLIEHRADGILTLTLNREERLNALTPAMLAALLQALRTAALDADVRTVVLTGAGRAFCAGGDVKAMAEQGGITRALEAKTAWLRESMECSRLLHEMPKPTLAIARGAVAGAGLSLALACDVVVAADNAKITSAFVKVGLSGDFGGSWFLSRRLGARARAFAFLSPVISGSEALAMGLVDRTWPDANVQTEGQALARELAARAPIAIGYLKQNLNCAENGATLAQTLDQEAIRHARCGMTEDHREAAAAFVEKRTATFIGR